MLVIYIVVLKWCTVTQTPSYVIQGFLHEENNFVCLLDYDNPMSHCPLLRTNEHHAFTHWLNLWTDVVQSHPVPSQYKNSTQQSGIILVFTPSLRMGSKIYPETSNHSYNTTPLHNPKQLHQSSFIFRMTLIFNAEKATMAERLFIQDKNYTSVRGK